MTGKRKSLNDIYAEAEGKMPEAAAAAQEEKHEAAPALEPGRTYTKVLVQPVGVDRYVLRVFYTEDDEESSEDPFEIYVPGGPDAINKRAVEFLETKRLRAELSSKGWFVE